MINKYLKGDLSEEDKKAFELRLKSDSSLREELDKIREDLVVKDLLFVSEAKRHIKSKHIGSTLDQKKIFNWKLWSMVFAILAGLLLGWYFLSFNSKEMEIDKLVETNFIAPYGQTQRGEETKTLIYQFEKLTFEKEYSDLIEIYKSLDNKNSTDAKAIKYVIYAYFKTGQIEKAIALSDFALSRASDNSVLYNKALLSLRENDLQTSREILSKMSAGKDKFYKEKAENLFNALD